MKPRTKVEKEVVRLSAKLPPLSEHQKRLAARLSKYENVKIFNRKKTDIIHFIIVTTKGGWQVLRHFYLYAVYKYKKLESTRFGEVMQQWYKDGEHVFMSRLTAPMSGYIDSWSFNSPLAIRKNEDRFSCLGYDKVFYARLQPYFSYIPKDDYCEERIDDLFRALNTHPFNETLYRNFHDVWKWSVDHGFAFDKQKTDAIRIAMRHKYNFMTILWKDMVEMLVYLGKDLRNPHFVCPVDLPQAHDVISRQAQRKREKIMRRIENMKMVRREREELERLERQARMEQKRQEALRSAVLLYPQKRNKFFGMVFTDGELEIRVLQSVDEFFEEGKEMGHCVFSNNYFDLNERPNSLIMSAKAHGERAETIEVDLKKYKVLQCRGKYNQETQYHERIMKMMSDNMNQIKSINENKRRSRTCKARI